MDIEDRHPRSGIISKRLLENDENRMLFNFTIELYYFE